MGKQFIAIIRSCYVVRGFSLGMFLLLLVTAQVESQTKSDTAKSDKKIRVVVMDLKARAGISAQEAASATGFLRAAIQKTKKYRLINREDISTIAKNHKIELTICDTDQCLWKVGNLLSAQKLVVGDIGILEKKYVINVRMVDVASAELENEEVCSRICDKDADMIQQTMNSITQEICYGVVNETVSNVAQGRGKDGALMVLIPAGEFLMGSPENKEGEPDEFPIHKIYLNAYYIDKHEVTNEQFKKFVEATKYKTDAEKSGGGLVYNISTNKWDQKSGASWRDPLGDGSGIDDKMNYPVVQVSWNDAVAYAAWAGKRLPTEAEWEKAARGTDNKMYPWGQEWDGKKCNFVDSSTEYEWKDGTINDGYQYTSPAGNYSDGASLYGVMDMAGNVWEWCSDWYDEKYYGISLTNNPKGYYSGTTRVVRGGSWIDVAINCRSANRNWSYPYNWFSNIGFRCAAGTVQE